MDNQGPIPFPLISSGQMWNHVDGRVISILYGLTRTTVKVMSEDEVILTVRCPSEKFEQVNVRIGQQVTAQVSAHDVLLGMAGMSFGKERWDRWSGRIVLVNSRDSAAYVRNA